MVQTRMKYYPKSYSMPNVSRVLREPLDQDCTRALCKEITWHWIDEAKMPWPGVSLVILKKHQGAKKRWQLHYYI